MILYQPAHFRIEEQAHALAVMQSHPFATLVSLHEGEPVFTHLPLHAQRVG